MAIWKYSLEGNLVEFKCMEYDWKNSDEKHMSYWEAHSQNVLTKKNILELKMYS